MSKRYPWAKWTLPTTIDPPRTCYTIPVPDDPYHKAAFRGALLALASAAKWQDDPAHTALAAAAVWQDIYDRVIECETSEQTESWDEDLTSLCEALRWRNGKLQALCCGSWTDIDGQPAQGWSPAGIGTGTTPPAAGGACADYIGAMGGAGYYYAPFVVNTGDTILVSNIAGATYNPANGGWYLLNGNQFFGGFDVGNPITAGGNPVPGQPSGKLVAKIGATFYDVYNGTFTVPGGVVSQPIQFQVNYASIVGSGGDVSFKVTFCNNVAASWSHTFDFTLSPQGFSPETYDSAAIGVWSAGIGWTNSDGLHVITNESFRGINIARLGLASFECLSMQMVYSITKGAFLGAGEPTVIIATRVGAASTIYGQILNPAQANGTGQVIGPVFSDHAGQTGLWLVNECATKAGGTAGLTGSAVITSLTITGKGPQPVW